MDDLDREKFLTALDDSDHELTDWEAQFIESNIGRKFFSSKQRQIIDEMMSKYSDV